MPRRLGTSRRTQWPEALLGQAVGMRMIYARPCTAIVLHAQHRCTWTPPARGVTSHSLPDRRADHLLEGPKQP